MSGRLAKAVVVLYKPFQAMQCGLCDAYSEGIAGVEKIRGEIRAPTTFYKVHFSNKIEEPYSIELEIRKRIHFDFNASFCFDPLTVDRKIIRREHLIAMRVRKDSYFKFSLEHSALEKIKFQDNATLEFNFTIKRKEKRND